jgi:hypothetical protein
MKFGAVVVCAKCQQPIVWAGWVYICFEIPGMEGYHFFHQGFPVGTAGKAT